MASGQLASLDIQTNNTNLTLYQVPAGTLTSFSLNFCNRNSSDVKVRIAISNSSTPGNGDFIEWDSVIPENETLQRLGLLAGASQYVIVRSDTISVSAVIWGIEETV